MTERFEELRRLGQSLWYDNIHRRMLESGDLEKLINDGKIRGVTSNPSIFNEAIGQSDAYDDELIMFARQGKTAGEIFEALAVEDIQTATDLFREIYEESDGGDGYVSIEVNPELAYDTDATCAEARRLWEKVNRPNLLVKIPATEAGIPAIRRSIADGLNINITLIFSRQRYVEVMEAYLSGLEDRLDFGEAIDRIASVASFFVSRIDTKADGNLEEVTHGEDTAAKKAAELLGKVAIANAKLAYQLHKEIYGGERFKALKAKGARLQRPLWASTSTKNPAYSDVKYVEELIGPDTVNTVPQHTLEAFADHGRVAATLEEDLDGARKVMDELEQVGVSMQRVTDELEQEGVDQFSRAYNDLLETIEARRKEVLEHA